MQLGEPCAEVDKARRDRRNEVQRRMRARKRGENIPLQARGRKAEPMEPIGTCASMYGWDILAIVENCPKHNCERFDLQTKSGTRKYAICPLCWRDDKKVYGRQFYRRYREKCVPGQRHVASETTEGSDDPFHPHFWCAQYDANIEKFWAKWGMTDEDAKIKWGSRPTAWRALMKQRDLAK